MMNVLVAGKGSVCTGDSHSWRGNLSAITVLPGAGHDTAKKSDVLLDTDYRKKLLNDLLEQYKGKVILLDFWASWCAPCRAQLYFERRLELKYAGKDIVFLFVSLDQDLTRWQKANQLESLPKGRSFLLYDALHSTLLNTFKIHSIPRCMLIGRNGTMLDDNAPWPYDAKLQKAIEAALQPDGSMK